MTNPETTRDHAGQSVAGEFVVPVLPEWFHEPGIGEQYRPWQHTPLDPYSDRMRGHQRELREVFERLIEIVPPSYESYGLEALVRLDFMSGMTMREAQCAANFHDWVQNHPEELATLRRDPDAEWVLGEGLAGHGSARGQLEILRRAPSLRSLDLQVLSTPFGYRRQHVGAMHEELREALAATGATVYDEPQWLENHPPKISMDPARDIRSNEQGRGLLVTYKRKVAELTDIALEDSTISVIERESWLVLTGAGSGFSQELMLEMWREPSLMYKDSAFAAQVQEYAMSRIQNNQSVIPLSTTTYAARAKVIDIVK